MTPPATLLAPAPSGSDPDALAHAPTFDPHPDPVDACRGELALTLGLRHAGPRRVVLRWEALGAGDLPTVVVLGGISADRHVAASRSHPEPGWWEGQVGPGRPVDPRTVRVLGVDWVGADGSLDVPLDTTDQADAVVSVLDHLGIGRVQAFVGCSYGALVGLQLAVRYRRRVGHLVAISGGARPHPYAAAYRALQRQVVALGTEVGRPGDALAIARQLGMLSYRSPAEFGARFPEPTALRGDTARCSPQDYLEACASRYVARWSAIAFRRLSESIDLHVIDPAAVRVPCTFAAVAGDWLAPPADVEVLARGVDAPASFHLIDSIFGHDAFLKEPDAIGAVLGHAFAQESVAAVAA